MDVPARLKWRKEKDRYVAYPTATDHDERFAEVRLYASGYDTDSAVHGPTQHWSWRVRWDGWFAEAGFWPDKQGAADKATEAWWKWVETEPPRDVDMEIAMIVARAVVRPVPNSLFNEDHDYLRKVLWHLHEVYRTELLEGSSPVKNLSEQLSAELFRRRESGEIPSPPSGGVILEKAFRRRRRRR